ncbi:MAG TPA: phosphoglycerate kinase [Phycisphaerae bacterium]|nr:phosphoglycerate kinase [Phycisphaerae bacterium]
MNKKTIDQINIRGKRVLVRLDLNVPLDGDRITDDRRIRAALPTIQKLIASGGRVILMSHLGRPTGDPAKDKQFTLAPVARRLGELLGMPVAFAPACVGPGVEQMVTALQDGNLCLLENLRFNTAETIKDKNAKDDPHLRGAKDDFAARLAGLADVYVNDAFGTCHRDNASMLTVPQVMEGKPRVVGYLVKKELEFLTNAVASPKRPFVVVLGGAKVSDKIGVIENLIDKCDAILIGGAMCYTFFAAEGKAVGKSLVEPDKFPEAKRLRDMAGNKLHLPADSVAAAEIKDGVDTKVCTDAIPDDLMGLDIGPATAKAYAEVLAGAKTVVWNGPMGVFETRPFNAGTLAIAHALADATDRGTVSIIGGGDSAAAVDAAGLAERMTHISTGGGASLELLEGKKFAAIEILDDA